jgi:hypothetical protein
VQQGPARRRRLDETATTAVGARMSTNDLKTTVLMRRLVVALLVVCSMAGCSASDAWTPRYGEPLSPIEAVQSLGQIGLPALPEFVAVYGDSGADTRYQIVMRLDDDQRDEFLSQFPIAPAPSEIPKSMPVIAGPALDSAPNPLYLQNAIGSPEGLFVREVIVDQRAPNETYVHISVYTT